MSSCASANITGEISVWPLKWLRVREGPREGEWEKVTRERKVSKQKQKGEKR
jgi:hypothetical protein